MRQIYLSIWVNNIISR